MKRWIDIVGSALVVMCTTIDPAGAQPACTDAKQESAAHAALMGSAAAPSNWTPGSPQASALPGESGVAVTLRPGAQPYPGVVLTPSAGKWDLAPFDQLVARVTNTGKTPARLGLRADDADTPKSGKWNDATIQLAPGETGSIRLMFGQAQGKPAPSVDRGAITRVIVFAQVGDTPVELRVEALSAAGQAAAAGAAPLRSKPARGVLVGDNCAERSVLAVGRDGARANLSGGHVQVQASQGQGSVLLRPITGSWDLRDALQMTAKVANAGSSGVKVAGRIESAEGDTEWTPAIEVPPGQTGILTLPFGAATPVALVDKPLSKYASDATTGVAFKISGNGQLAVNVDDLRAGLPAPQRLPDWIGKRPPVPGDWKMTLNEDFNGGAADASRWSVTGTNYWDKASHFSKQNLIVAGGNASLRFERRSGHANDDPSQSQTDYTTGYLSSVGKWTQRYGYFEARMKLPKAPGLWPAFWLMPDRGTAAADAKERLSTLNGGMEFDILEHLTRFGPNRYNVALHWDGYGDQHKTTSDDGIYVQPDADGYVVAGLLWEPGSVAFYANGKEVAHRSDARISSVPSYVLFTLVSGGWGGNELSGSGLPDELKIDWVRAWQRASR